ncbi:MAG: hypothetical protein IT204_10605 [Fimbriimonadaceae bacterium]|nr:hypothetical protein [Fimbriimonadaceae bacterium]
MARTVLHVQLPGVYVAAAVEEGQVAAGQPVVVRRGDRIVDVAGIPELRRGQPVRVARRLAPRAVVVPVEAVGGAEVLRAVWDKLLEMGPAVEPSSWQSGYVDVTGCLPRRGVAAHLAALAKRLSRLTGQPPAQGMAANKLVARHASPLRQMVAPEETTAFLQEQPLRPGQGLASRLVEQLGELGCRLWGEVAAVPEPRLYSLFGPLGTLVHRWSQGHDPRPVQAKYPPPSETVSAAVEGDEHGGWVVHLGRLADRLAARLQQRGELATEVILEVVTRETTLRRPRRFPRGITSDARLRAVVLGLLPTDLDPQRVEELRLTVRGLRRRGVVQGVLVWDEPEERRHLVDGVIAAVRESYTLRSLGWGADVLTNRERLAESVWRLEGAGNPTPRRWEQAAAVATTVQGLPARLAWGPGEHAVEGVLDRWQETGRWWDGEPRREFFRVEAAGRFDLSRDEAGAWRVEAGWD